jgi:quercetin dioxygenase-like cupin family protein
MKPLSLTAILATSALALAAGGTATPPMGSAAVSWEDIVAKPAKGLSRPVFQAPTATLDELEVHVTTLPPGVAPHPPHKHPDEEIIIIKEGTVEAMVNGESRRLGAGSVIFQAAGQLHTIKNVGDVPAVYHVIKWNSPGMLKARQP